MSNLHESVPEGNVDISRPSTSLPSTSQSFRSKGSLHMKVKEARVCSPSKKSTKLSPKRQNEYKTPSSRTNPIDELSLQCQNLSVNTMSDEVDHGDSLRVHKRKNRRKKDRHFCLSAESGGITPILQMPTNVATQMTPPQEHSNYFVQNQMTSMQNLFMQQVAPLYANADSIYVENLSYHPQYQYMQSVQAIEMLQNQNHIMSAPNTPIFMQVPNSPIIPNSPLLANSVPTTPRYLQNMMQHPLLRKSYSLESQSHLDQSQRHRSLVQTSHGGNSVVPLLKKSQPIKKKHKQNEENCNEDKKFDQYLAEEDVSTGLKNNAFIEGVLRINPKQFQHSYISCIDRSERDIFIDGVKNRNRALEGDTVIVELLSDGENDNADDGTKQKKGKVVFIKERLHNRTCIGTLKLMADKNRQKALFVPRDNRIPRLYIPFTSWPDNFYQDAKKYESTLFLAIILDWFDIRFALGKIVCNIGQSGDMITETKAILAQTDLDVTPYGSEYRHLYPRPDYVIPDEEIKLREDCRKICLFSIDPSNCRDIDDAVSCRELDNGNYEIGVHISDVAHFLTENTPLDEKVADKATTIYMVERAYHMLPDELCMLCSLFPGVDKLAFSVFWEITPKAQVLRHRFSKTVIQSCSQLSYDHAQAILEDKEDAKSLFPETYNGFQYKDIYKSIKILGKIAAIFRRDRFENGALRIDQPKVSFCLNASDGLPESYWIYESKDSHQLIEEYMLLANMTVANRIHNDHPKIAFLRCHPPPIGYMLTQLANALKPMGIELDICSAGDLHRSLLHHMRDADNIDRGKAMVLSMLCAKPMARAKYFCADGCNDEDLQHYALNVPLYTHFTSPIRRYADIMVHRLLAASLNYREVPKWEVDKVRMIAAQCNKQKYNAKIAGEMSTELYTLKYIEMHSPLVTEAVVVEVKEKYIDVIIVAMGLNRRIFFNNDFPGKFRCIKNEAGAKLSKMELTWKAEEHLEPVIQIIQVFSILQVEMHKAESDMVKVETKLVRPKVEFTCFN